MVVGNGIGQKAENFIDLTCIKTLEKKITCFVIEGAVLVSRKTTRWFVKNLSFLAKIVVHVTNKISF